MAVKSQSDDRTISTTNKKLTVKTKKTLNSHKDNFSHLSEEIVSNVSVGIYIVQSNRFTYVSPVFQNLSGYSFDELAGTNPLDYVHPDDREMVRNNTIKNLTGINKSL